MRITQAVSELSFSISLISSSVNGLCGLAARPLALQNEAKLTEIMFACCSSLEYIDGLHFNTSSVTSMESMFDGCKSIRTLDLSGWDTSKVTNMKFMFAECGRTYADALAEDHHSLAAMFAAPRSKLEVSNWDTSNVTDMYGIFQNAWFWEDPDVSRWDMSRVKPDNTAWSDGTRQCRYIRE